MKKIYLVEHNYQCDAVFEVDTEVFTNEMAQMTLDFFLWDYDQYNDPIQEVLKKYAKKVIELSSYNNINEVGVIEEFNSMEGFTNLDGSTGLKLLSVTGIHIDSEDLSIRELKITNLITNN